MRVKVGELKTHLSKYLRQLRQTGESIEVCVREEPVAYLTARPTGSQRSGREHLAEKLRRSGIRWTNAAHPPKKDLSPPSPGIAADGRTDRDTVAELRAEKDW